jgi:hypothetical protein
MSAVPAAHHLTDFGVHADIVGQPPRSREQAGLRNASPEAKLEEAFARGAEEAKVAAQGEFEAKYAAQEQLFAERLAQERQSWAAGAGEKLAVTIVSGFRELETRVAETTARVLKPFLAAELHRQAIAELQANLELLLTTGTGVSLHISGPPDILQAVRAQLAGRTSAVTYDTSNELDVRIVAGQAALETCLREWMAKLEEAVR